MSILLGVNLVTPMLKTFRLCRRFIVKKINFGRSTLSEKGPCYIIAESGNNHQGDLKVSG